MIAEVGDIENVSGKQDRDAIGAAEAGQHADDDAEHDADDHHHDVEGLEHHGEAVKEIKDFFHLVARPAPRLLLASVRAVAILETQRAFERPFRQGDDEPLLEDQEGDQRHADRDRQHIGASHSGRAIS